MVQIRLVQVIYEFIFLVLWLIVEIFDIFLFVDFRDREYNTWVIQQIPDRGITPVARLLVRRGSTKGRRTKNNVDFMSILFTGASPVTGVGSTISFSFSA